MSTCDNDDGNLLDNRSGCKGLGGAATGYWGRSVYKRIRCEQVYEKERAALQDMLAGAGIRMSLWRGVTSGVTCSCYKASNRQGDRKCKTCHGVIDGLIPGYLKFGYNTLWMSASDTDLTLTNVEITTDFKSSKAGLTSSALSGTVESPDKAFSRTAIGSEWESQAVTFIRIDGSSTALVEYSLDSGSTWTDLSQLSTANPSSGTIRFRATLTRTSTDVLTPFFEIVRARYATIDLEDPRGDGTCTYGPWIRVLNGKPFQGYRKSDYGDFPTMDGMSFWLSGLSQWDPSIAVNTPAELLVGPNLIFEILDGALVNKRYTSLNWKHSDPGAYQVVTQEMQVQIENPAGAMALIW
jgi:hypothetical protein